MNKTHPHFNSSRTPLFFSVIFDMKIFWRIAVVWSTYLYQHCQTNQLIFSRRVDVWHQYTTALLSYQRSKSTMSECYHIHNQSLLYKASINCMVLTIINVLQTAKQVAGRVLVPGLGALSLFSLVPFPCVHRLLLPPEVRSGVKVLQSIVDLLSNVFVCWVVVTCHTCQSIFT